MAYKIRFFNKMKNRMCKILLPRVCLENLYF
jgi:hypothetical protein